MAAVTASLCDVRVSMTNVWRALRGRYANDVPWIRVGQWRTAFFQKEQIVRVCIEDPCGRRTHLSRGRLRGARLVGTRSALMPACLAPADGARLVRGHGLIPPTRSAAVGVQPGTLRGRRAGVGARGCKRSDAHRPDCPQPSTQLAYRPTSRRQQQFKKLRTRCICSELRECVQIVMTDRR